jgi:hypothetical protein
MFLERRTLQIISKVVAVITILSMFVFLLATFF